MARRMATCHPDRVMSARDLCSSCYPIALKTGAPMRPPLSWDERLPPLEQRFWENVDKSGGCWIWTGTISDHRYGAMKIHGKTFKAHRLAWTLTKGEIPKGLRVLHRCDNPPCVRPDHLFLGTQEDNMQDCVRKGRFNTTAAVLASRAAQLRKTHCARGHEYAGDNLTFETKGTRRARRCRACLEANNARKIKRQREARCQTTT